jgi:hypothetical protein
MKALLFVFTLLSAAWAQSAAGPASDPPPIPNIPDDEVVAIFGDGTKFTMGDFKQIYPILPPAQQQMALRDREAFLHQWELWRKVAKIAELSKLDQESPYKQQIEYARMNVLFPAQINAVMNQVPIEPGEIVKFYDANKRKYSQVKVKAIFIAFSDAASSTGDNGKKALTEAEAKAEATRLLAAIKGGADFVKLAKENSQDETSRAKDGDFATLHYGDNIPNGFRAAVFALKQGEVSEPLKQPNGFYLLRAEEVAVRPLSEVRDEIRNELQLAHADEWMRKMDQETKVQLVNPAFGSHPPAPAVPAGK